MQRGRNVGRRVTALLTLGATGCSTWHKEAGAGPQVVSEKRPNVVRLALKAGGYAVVYDPRIEGDSIVGRDARKQNAQRVAYGLTEVDGAATRHFSAVKTAIAVSVAVMAIGILTSSGSSSSSDTTAGSCSSSGGYILPAG